MNKARLPRKSRFSYNNGRKQKVVDTMKPVSYMAIVLCVMLFLTGCSSGAVDEEVNESVQNKTAVQNKTEPFTRNTKIEDVINAPSFEGFGRLLFPFTIDWQQRINYRSQIFMAKISC